jgi:hypothetical protein
MSWHTLTPIFTWLILAIIFTAWLWRWKPKDKLTALLVLLCYEAMNLFFALGNNWALANYYLIAIPFILMLAMIPRTLRKFRYSRILGQEPLPFLPHNSRPRQVFLAVVFVLAVGSGWLSYGVLRSYFYSGAPILMFLPVRNGMYAVANGGNGMDGFGMNTYLRTWFGVPLPNADPTYGYAADIYKMKALGNPTERSSAANPLNKYAIFNDLVYVPCFGQVVFVEDGHADVKPYEKAETKLGNYIVLQCETYYVTIAGFKKDSIILKEGDMVRPPMQIGHVGNSAEPGIPHLHVHVTRDSWRSGTPVPILFDGWLAVNQFPVRNKFFIP